MAPLCISRILHAGYLFEHEGLSVAFDPIFENPFSGNCHAFPDVRFDEEAIRRLELDAVFISHFHEDHCSLESLNLLRRETPIYVYCLDEALRAMIRALGFTQVHAIELDALIDLGALQIIARRALDAEIDALFEICAAGLHVLHVVDAWIDPATLDELRQRPRWDLVLWPFQTMRELEVLTPTRAAPASGELPPEWIEQLIALKPRAVVASACQFQLEPWSWYNQAFFPISVAGFRRQIQAILPAAEVLRLNPGAAIRLDGDHVAPAEPLPWIEVLGDPEGDYDYQPALLPPPTAEIAQHFPALSSAEAEVVADYCRRGLLARYRVLGPAMDDYFLRPRRWLLSVYDHRGEPTHYPYALDDEAIEPAEDGAWFDWTTELPAAKLYGALELGESLTSMYLRINAGPIPASLDAALASADVLEDPLIRCLFQGVFGAYQRAQLRRLSHSAASFPRRIEGRSTKR